MRGYGLGTSLRGILRLFGRNVFVVCTRAGPVKLSEAEWAVVRIQWAELGGKIRCGG